MKILVTGGAGFIGSHTVDRLISMGHEVTVLDSLTSPVHRSQFKIPYYFNNKAKLIVGDVRNEKILLESLKEIDIIFHFAAFQDLNLIFSKFVDVNIYSTAKIYELILRYNLPIKKIIVASSQAAAGEGIYIDSLGKTFVPEMRTKEELLKNNWEVKVPEGYKPPIKWIYTDEKVSSPVNAYGISKLSEEMFAISLGKRYNIPTVAMRYSIVQGSRQSFYNLYSGACRIFSMHFSKGKKPKIFEDGNQVRDFVNIHDVVDANILVMENDKANYEVFNVGCGQPITINEFAKIVSEVFEFPDYVPEPSGTYRFGDTRHICSDISKLKSLGWSPIRTTYDSVKEYKEYIENFQEPTDLIPHELLDFFAEKFEN